MSCKDRFVELVKKYGPAAKVVAGAVLNVVAPGSGALVGLVDKAFDTAEDLAQGHWEAELMRATQQNAAELARLGSLFELLTGDLAKLCDEAFAFHDQPDDIEDIVRRALASDRGLADGLRKLDALVADFACVKEQQRRLLEGQDEMLPILRRLHSVLPFLEDCQQAGANPRELLLHRQAILLGIQLRQPQQACIAVQRIEDSGKHGDTHLFKAGIALVDRDFPSVQSELGEVVRRHPHDHELIELHRRATVMATGVTPRSAPVGESSRLSDRVDTNPDVGDVLDGWMLEARLGSGGWGQVFKATRGTETAALKIMHVRYSRDANFVARFRGEIRTLMRLPSHPNLLRILDFNYATERFCWYLVTEYIDGPTLDKYLQDKGALSAEQAHKVFAPVSDGLAHAHAAGIVHRDIKPGNFVFRKKDRQLVLVDFGLAVHAENVGQTKVGGLTLMFGSPEQKSGLPADARGDVFSLAATISFALLYDKPDLRNPIHFDAEEIPLTLRGALAKAMETNPRRRYADGREFHAALTATTHLAAELAPREPVAPKHPAPVIPKSKPAILDCTGPNGADPQRVKTLQNEWSKYLGVPALETLDLGGGVKLELVLIPPGKFMMGSPGSEKEHQDDEILHQVELTRPYYLCKFPVTQEQYTQVMQVTNPSGFCAAGDYKDDVNGLDTRRFPVEQVNWEEAVEFCNRLASFGRGNFNTFRLPTEAEWEYACRAGTRTPFHFGTTLNGSEANCDGNNPYGTSTKGKYLQRTCEVGKYAANALGLYDMHGNVWEWCMDWYGAYPTAGVQNPPGSESGSRRVSRGGGWSSDARDCRAALRFWLVPGERYGILGFRLALVPSGVE